MKRKIFILIFIFLGCLPTFATIQIPDKLIYNGIEYKLDNAYLEYFFEKNPNKNPEFEVTSTALWKGYIATFEIEDNQLFLINIEIMENLEGAKTVWKSILNDIFPDSKKVKAEWFSGILWGGYNDKTNYSSFEYDNYSIFEIEEGNIVESKELKKKEYNKFKKQQIKAFEQTQEYQERIKKVKENHSIQNKEMLEYTQDMLEKVRTRLEESGLPDENAEIIANNTPSDENLKKYAEDLESIIKSYESAKELSNKEVKEIIFYSIFSYMPKFLE